MADPDDERLRAPGEPGAVGEPSAPDPSPPGEPTPETSPPAATPAPGPFPEDTGILWAIDRVATEVPAVVAVVVAHDPGPWLEESLEALAAQDYPDLKVLVVDNASTEAVADRVAAVLADAFVLALDEDRGWGAAIDRAVEAVEGAQFLLLCHDDVALDPDAVRILVEEAYRSNAAIVGPKLVDWDEPDVLAEVGLSVDKFGIPFSAVEPGEVDQEQHDAVRDVFMVSGATMLVRADLFGEVGGFDETLFHRVADMDLCWRARLLGARIVVAPNAVGRHRSAFRERTGTTRSTRAWVYRSRMRTLFKVSSPLTLVALVPQIAVMTAFAVLRFALVGRFGVARSWISAWTWNLRQIGLVRRCRKPVQASRVVPDQELRPLQVRTSTRLRSWSSARFDADRRGRAVAAVGRELANTTQGSLREPVFVGFIALVVVVLAGSRGLVTDGVPAVGSFLPWPGARSMWDAFTSPWRFAGLGSDGAAPPAFAVMAGMSTVLGGHPDLARTVLVVAAIPVGAVGAFRLTAPLSSRPWAGLAGALTYAALPVPRDAVAAGRLGPLVLYALAPYLLRRVLLTGGPGPFAGRVAEQGAQVRRPDLARSILSLAVLTAVTGAFEPLALVVVPGLSVVVLAAALVAGGVVDAARSLAATVVATALAVALLAPWSLGLLRPDPDGGALGVVFRPDLSATDVIRFDSGPATGGWLVLGLGLVGLLPFLAGTGWRAAWCARAWAITVVGWALAWLPGQDRWEVPWPVPQVPLTVAALGLAVAVGVGTSVLTDELRAPTFGLRQTLGVLAGGALVVGSFPALVDAADGRWELPERDWAESLSFTASPASPDEGRFSMLWLGDPEVLPLDASLMPGRLGYGVTRDGPGDARALWPADAERDGQPLEDLVGTLLAGGTTRLGHQLAPLGVRYVVVPSRAAPGAGATADARIVDPLLAELARQTDLERLVKPDLVLYENTAWAPSRALLVPELYPELDRPDVAAAQAAGSLDEAAALELWPAIAVLGDGRLRLTGDLYGGFATFAERYDDDWELRQDGVAVPHTAAFGVTNGYRVAVDGPAVLEHAGQRPRLVVVAAEGALWVLVLLVLRRRAAVDRAAVRRLLTGPGRRFERSGLAERRARRHADDDELWGGFEQATRPPRWGRRYEPDDEPWDGDSVEWDQPSPSPAAEEPVTGRAARRARKAARKAAEAAADEADADRTGASVGPSGGGRRRGRR